MSYNLLTDTTETKIMAWDDIKTRFSSGRGEAFWAVVDRDGNWVDSAMNYHTALHWAACDSGVFDATVEQQLTIIEEEKYSIIPSHMLEKMADAGLIK